VSRLRRQDGFTLPELLTTLAMIMVIVLAAFALLETTMRRTGETALRVEANQRGRQAMETIMRVLRSQTCVSTTNPAVLSASGNSLSIQATLRDGQPPSRFVYTFNPATQQLWQETTTGSKLPPETVYTATPTRKLLAENIALDGSTPFFTYYGFNAPTPPTAPTPSLQLADPVPATERRLVARIGVRFVSKPSKTAAANERSAVVFSDEVFARQFDPNDSIPEPTCA
jgi:type II secretory pathway pseudopilin PulG